MIWYVREFIALKVILFANSDWYLYNFRRSLAAALTHNLIRADAIRGQQYDFSPPDVLLRRVAVLNQSPEPTNIGGRNGERFSSAFAQARTSNPPSGIPSGLKC